MNRTVVITMGRNINGKPMQLQRWRHFQGEVSIALQNVGATIIQEPTADAKRSHDQVGVWQGHEEPACTFVAIAPHNWTYSGQLIDQLRRIAYDYDQQAIGYINVAGDDHMVTPYGVSP